MRLREASRVAGPASIAPLRDQRTSGQDQIFDTTLCRIDRYPKRLLRFSLRFSCASLRFCKASSALLRLLLPPAVRRAIAFRPTLAK